MVLVRNC